MPHDIFPIYCRHCRRQMPGNASVCPHCGRKQGLGQDDASSQSTAAPQQAAPARPSAQWPPQPSQAQGQAACRYCGVVITPGDYFCRACGRDLVPGVGRASDGAQAYGRSAMVCGCLGFIPGALILGITAMIKGARGMGCLSIVVSLVVAGVIGVLGGAWAKSMLESALSGFTLEGLVP